MSERAGSVGRDGFTEYRNYELDENLPRPVWSVLKVSPPANNRSGPTASLPSQLWSFVKGHAKGQTEEG